MNDSEVQVAEAVAREAHHGQVRWGGLDYFESHCRPVATRARSLYGPREESLALLHDVFEDSRLSPDLVVHRGVSTDTVRSALLLRHQPNESYRDYILRVASSGNVAAIRVKLLDLEDNVKTPLPPHVSSDRIEVHRHRVAKYELAMVVLSEALARLSGHG